MTEPYADFAEKVFICPICGEFELFANMPKTFHAKKFTEFQKKHSHEKKSEESKCVTTSPDI